VTLLVLGGYGHLQQAEHLVGFMLGDLNDKLAQVQRLDIMEAVDDQAMQYFQSLPTTDVTEMMRPKRAFIIDRAAARINRNAASRLIRMTSSNSSSFMRIRRLSRVTPALLTRMSSLPLSASTACGTNWSTAAPSLRLHGKAT